MPNPALAHLPAAVKIALPAGLVLVVLAVVLIAPPLAQDPAYHAFADSRAWLGIGNVADVASNLAYLAAGLAGLAFLLSPGGRRRIAYPLERLPWLVFFSGVVLVAAGSAWYHHAPGNGTLVWDRLPMTLAFMALFSGFIADRIAPRFSALVVLPVMVTLGVASVLYWYAGETGGAGDLRFYFLLNPVLPALILPYVCAHYSGRLTRGRRLGLPWLAWIVILYGAAIVCEQADHAIFALTDGSVSGHTIKHLLSAGAVVAVLAMLRHNENGGS
jgi:hypothetical protein